MAVRFSHGTSGSTMWVGPMTRPPASPHFCNLDLVVCIAAAQRRGMMDADEAKRQGFEDNNLIEGFRISGLGQLIEAGIESDRLVVFGA